MALLLRGGMRLEDPGALTTTARRSVITANVPVNTRDGGRSVRGVNLHTWTDRNVDKRHTLS